MKIIKKLVLTLLLFVGVTSYTHAQSKIAHINVQTLLTEMPEMQAIQAELQKLEQTYTADITASIKELQAKSKAVQDEVSTLTDEQIKARRAEFDKKAEELDNMQSNINEAQKAAYQDLQQKRQEKMAPLYKKVQDAIESVATKLGYDYVLDATQGGGIIVAKGKDLLPDVKKELGI